MSLQERTLVVRNFDPERTTDKLLRELCLQGGPVRKVILRSDHAFVEFEDVDSVGYTKALLDGIKMFDRPLSLEPKLRLQEYTKYTAALHDYVSYDKYNRNVERRRRQLEEQQRLQMQMQMQYQQQQTVPLPYSHQSDYQLQMQYQPLPPQSQSRQHQHQQQPPNFQGPQYRNYR